MHQINLTACSVTGRLASLTQFCHNEEPILMLKHGGDQARPGVHAKGGR